MAANEPSGDPGGGPSRVRVLDPEEASPSPARQRSLPWVLVAFGGLMVIGVWLTGGTRQAGLGDAVATDSRAFAASSPRVPELSGMRIEEVRDALGEAGFVEELQVPRERWVASETVATGQVMSQEPPAGTALAEGNRVGVVVSSGGPIVRFDSIPADIRSWAAGLPGFDPAEPVLLRSTAAGPAYKTDTWLFGECTAVAIAVETFPDSSYGEDCIVRATSTVSGVLPDGTRYEVAGLLGNGYAAGGASGAIMIDDEVGRRTLGVVRYVRAAESEPAGVEWRGDELHITVGNWIIDVTVNSEILSERGGAIRDRIQQAVRPKTIDGYVVLELNAPLRYQAPGEVPSRVSVDHGSFRVIVGCVTGVRNVVCDPTGTISAEGSLSGFDLAGVTVALVSGAEVSE